MSLKDRIAEDIKAAMKAKDKIRLETVRSIKKVLLEKEVSLRAEGREELSEAQEIELLAQQAKQRRDSIAQYRQGGREDLAEKEEQELHVIESYLPRQLSDEELAAEVEAAIAASGATSIEEIGKVMGLLMQKLKGKADGSRVQGMVKEKLGG